MDEGILLRNLKAATEEIHQMLQATQESEEHGFSNPQVGPAPEAVTDHLNRQYNQKLTSIVCGMKDVALSAGSELKFLVGLVEFMQSNGLTIGPVIEQQMEELLASLHREDNGSEHDDHSGYRRNGAYESYGSEVEDEDDVIDYDGEEEDDDDDVDDDQEEEEDDDDERTESTALATNDYDLGGSDEWRAATGSHLRAQRRINATADDFSQDSHMLGECDDIEEGQRSEQDEEVDSSIRAYAERLVDVEQQADTWVDDEDPGWVAMEISIAEFQEQEQDAIDRLQISEEVQTRIKQWTDDYETHERRLQQMQQSRAMGHPVSLNLQEDGGEAGDDEGEVADDEEDAYEGLDDDLDEAEAQLGQLPAGGRDRSSIVRPPANDTQSVASQMSEERDRITDMFDQHAVWPERRSQRDSIRPADIQGQLRMRGVQGEQLGVLNLRVIFEPHKTGFEESKDFNPPLHSIIAGKYKVREYLGQAAFSTALHCVDMKTNDEVCLKMIKNNKDYFDQSIDEIKLLQYINTRGDPDQHHVLRLYDFFYHKEHLFIVSELLRENLYDFQRFLLVESGQPNYFTIPRLKKIMKQVLEALQYIHSLNLIHCDVKPENIVIKSYSRCEVKLIDFGSSCYTHDHATSYIQSRSYRAPEVILGLAYDQKIDIWSLGAVLAELFTGYVLFQNDSIQTMLARIGGIVGPFPEHMVHAGTESHRYFTVSGIVYEALEDGSGAKLIYAKPTTLQHRLHTDDPVFLDFTRQMLTIDPMNRPSAWEALNHSFLEEIDEEAVMYKP